MKLNIIVQLEKKCQFFPQSVALVIYLLPNSSTIFHKWLIIGGLEKAEVFPIKEKITSDDNKEKKTQKNSEAPGVCCLFFLHEL